MVQENVARTGEILFSLIELKFSSDAAFERAANLPPKTVNNWKRGRSSSFMKMLPELAALFGVSVKDLLCTDEAEASGSQQLTAEEQEFLALFRATSSLSDKERAALTETVRSTIDLYMAARRGSNGR